MGAKKKIPKGLDIEEYVERLEIEKATKAALAAKAEAAAKVKAEAEAKAKAEAEAKAKAEAEAKAKAEAEAKAKAEAEAKAKAEEEAKAKAEAEAKVENKRQFFIQRLQKSENVKSEETEEMIQSAEKKTAMREARLQNESAENIRKYEYTRIVSQKLEEQEER